MAGMAHPWRHNAPLREEKARGPVSSLFFGNLSARAGDEGGHRRTPYRRRRAGSLIARKETIMAGVDVGDGGGRKRARNSEVNMIPFIDLLMCTIAFLLITAVWVTNSRLNADAQVPGDGAGPVNTKEERTLHLTVGENDFGLAWKQGKLVTSENHVPKSPVVVDTGTGNKVVRYPDLAKAVQEAWKEQRVHFDIDDKQVDQCTLHTDDRSPYSELVAVMDALYSPKRDMRLGGEVKRVPVFNMTFSLH
jgi:biopolymer transport protein ExbD